MQGRQCLQTVIVIWPARSCVNYITLSQSMDVRCTAILSRENRVQNIVYSFTMLVFDSKAFRIFVWALTFRTQASYRIRLNKDSSFECQLLFLLNVVAASRKKKKEELLI